MIGTRVRTRNVSLSLCLLLVVCLAVFGVGLAVAESDDTTIETDETALTVTVDNDSIIDEGEQNISVTITPADGTERTTSLGPDDENVPLVYTHDLEDQEDLEAANLSNTTVTVDYRGETLTERSGLDLRYIDLERSSFDGATLVVDTTGVGILDGSKLAFDAVPDEGSDQEPTRFTATYDDGEDRLVFERDEAFEAFVSTYNETFLSAASNEPIQTSVPLEFSIDKIAETQLVAGTGDRIDVVDPRFVSDQTYDVRLETTDPDGLYLTNATADNGTVGVEHETARFAASAAVEVSHDDEPVRKSDEMSIEPIVVDASFENKSIAVDGLEADEYDVFARLNTTSIDSAVVPMGSLSATDEGVSLDETTFEFTDGEEYILVFVADDEVVRSSLVGSAVNVRADEHTDENQAGIFDSIKEYASALWSSAQNTVNHVRSLGLGVIALLGLVPAVIVVLVLVIIYKRRQTRKRIRQQERSKRESKRGLNTAPAGAAGASASGTGGTPASSPPPTRDVTVELVDDETGNPAVGTRKVVFEDGFGQVIDQTWIENGRGTTTIPKGNHRAIDDATPASAPVSDDSATITLSPSELTFSITDERTGSAIENATVSCRTDDGGEDSTSTSSSGEGTISLPQSHVDANRDVTLTVTHDRYQRKSRTGPIGSMESDEDGLYRIALEPETGAVAVRATLDGTPMGDVDVSIEPTEAFTKPQGSIERSTDEGGRVRIADLAIGTYRVTASYTDTDDGSVAVDPESVRIEPDETATCEIDGTFTFTLDDRRDRIDSLRQDIRDLSSARRDAAIPYYYGSVLEELLEVVDGVPDAGPECLSHGVDPATLVDALLDAIEAAIEYTREAMTTKQNVDLFGACGSLREVRVDWTGERTAADLVDHVSVPVSGHRPEVASTLESVDELISTRRRDVASISPVREEYDAVRASVRSRSASDAEQLASLFVDLCLLEALESLFDHPELVDRLEQTVF